ncbi:MAG: zinc ribbon domain-containing protein [Ruminococcus sp.]|nr:zinc ribbon domain-containing protein [Ruminococcus sp.]
MFCKHCGKDIDIKSRTCPFCGEKTDFLTGIDGGQIPEHIKKFEGELTDILNKHPQSRNNSDGEEYEDISSYHTGPIEEERYINNNVSDHPIKDTQTKRKKNKKSPGDEPADEKGAKVWRVLMIVCIVVIVVSLIIIAIASSMKNRNQNVSTEDTAVNTTTTVVNSTETVTSTTVPAETTQPTTVATTQKSIEEYLNEAVSDDDTAMQTAQKFYADFESACASGDYNKFKSYFNSSYSEDDIKKYYDEYQAECAGYSSFVVGYTHTVSCGEFTYVYIAATTNLETGDYVENTFVLSADGKLDQSDGAKAWLAQAPAVTG